MHLRHTLRKAISNALQLHYQTESTTMEFAYPVSQQAIPIESLVNRNVFQYIIFDGNATK